MDELKVDDLVEFSNLSPFYDRYKESRFVVTEVVPQRDAAHDHIWLLCKSDPPLILECYIDSFELRKIST